MKYTTHTKGHYGIEDPELKFSKEGIQEHSYEIRQRSQKHKSAKMAWECGTNEYLCLPSATILWCPSCQLPEDKNNNETHLSASTELSGLENLGFHSPLLDYYQWLKVHTSGIREIQVAGRIQ